MSAPFGSRVSAVTGGSDIEDIELHQRIVDLQMQEIAYQAALFATERVIQPSFHDFLR